MNRREKFQELANMMQDAQRLAIIKRELDVARVNLSSAIECFKRIATAKRLMGDKTGAFHWTMSAQSLDDHLNAVFYHQWKLPAQVEEAEAKRDKAFKEIGSELGFKHKASQQILEEADYGKNH